MVTQPKCHSSPSLQSFCDSLTIRFFLAHARKKMSVKSATTKKPDCNYSFLVCKSQFCNVVKINFSASNLHNMSCPI